MRMTRLVTCIAHEANECAKAKRDITESRPARGSHSNTACKHTSLVPQALVLSAAQSIEGPSFPKMLVS